MQHLNLSSNIAATSSPAMRTAIANLHLRKGVSEAVRTSLSMYAHKAKHLKVPEKFQPPENYADRYFITTVVSPALKDNYIAHANSYGIPVAELILRCLSEYLNA